MVTLVCPDDTVGDEELSRLSIYLLDKGECKRASAINLGENTSHDRNEGV